MSAPFETDRLAAWFARQLSDVDVVTLDDLVRPADGASAETLLTTLRWSSRGRQQCEQVVLRICPRPPRLIEPYDLGKQFDVLRALESTDVLAPRALWIDRTAEVIGREFYVMARSPGAVHELGPPAGTTAEQANRMCYSMIEQLAAIHTVDVEVVGLGALDGGGTGHLTREVAHWTSELDRASRGAVPALRLLAATLADSVPAQSQLVTLVHGDPKPGNIAFVGDTVTAMFDWEMTTVGDPLVDIGWIEMTWLPWVLTPGAPSMDELLQHYEQLTAVTVRHREWYRALAKFKLCVILLLGGALFDAGHSDDVLVAEAAHLIHPMATNALQELGVTEIPEAGAVLPDQDRVRAMKELS